MHRHCEKYCIHTHRLYESREECKNVEKENNDNFLFTYMYM